MQSTGRFILNTLLSLLIVIGALLVLTFLLPNRAPEALLFGWIKYLPRVLPKLHLTVASMIGTTASTASGLLVLIGGCHLFCRWLSQQLKSKRWRLRWTLSAAAIIALLFLSSMSVMGLAHQTAWLITSPTRLTARVADANCAGNLRQIGLGLMLYASDHSGQYPPDLVTLALNEEIPSAVFRCASYYENTNVSSTSKEAAAELRSPGYCNYIYLGAGLSEPVPANQIIIVEPPANHSGQGMNVLYGDGHIEWVDRQPAAAIFDQYGLADDGSFIAKEKR